MGLVASLATMAIGAGITSVFQEEANNRQYRQNKDLMTYQNDLQMQTWQAQQNAINEYNAPVNQIKRLEDAGINPNSMGNVQGNYSSVSPEASVGLGSTNPQSASPDFNLFGKIAESILQGEGLEIQRKQAETNEKDVETSIPVKTAQVEVLLKQKEKTDADIAKIHTEIKAIDQEILQKWEQIRQGLFDLKTKMLRLGVDMYNSRWQQNVAEYNASTDRTNAVTKRMEFGLAKEAFKKQASQFDDRLNFDRQKFSSELKAGNIDRFLKIAEIAGFKLFGTNVITPGQCSEAIAIVESFTSNMDRMTEADKIKCYPVISKIQQGLTNLEGNLKNGKIDPKKTYDFFDKNRGMSDHFHSFDKHNPYINSFDMSDAF